MKNFNFKRFVSLMLIIGIAGMSFSDSAEARRRRRKHRSKVKRAVINEPVLFERMGGSKVVAELVDEWVKAALADGRLSGAFGDVTAKPDILVKLRKNLNAHLCELADGPCGTRTLEVKKAPVGLTMPEEKFVVFADHLVHSMEKHDIREREKNELLGRLGESHADTSPDAESED